MADPLDVLTATASEYAACCDLIHQGDHVIAINDQLVHVVCPDD